jgi:hypothetical protein
VGQALTTLSTVLLGKPNGTQAEIEARLAQPLTPAEELALKQADDAFLLSVLDKANAAESIESQDRMSARDMQKSVHSRTPDVLSFIVLGLFACEMVLAHFWAVPSENRDAASQVAGVLNISMGTVLGFWLGGSLGSRTKDVLAFARGGRS